MRLNFPSVAGEYVQLNSRHREFVDPLSCILASKYITKWGYERAQARVKKPAAKATLKEYYVASVSALQGILPQAQEQVINYDKRQGNNRTKLEEMWPRFDVEH